MEKSNIITRIIIPLQGIYPNDTLTFRKESYLCPIVIVRKRGGERKSLIRVLERTGYGSRFKNIQCFRAGQFKNRIQQRTS